MKRNWKAMVLAAGRGERMRPLTDTLPKPLVKVAGRTLLDRQLDVVERAGIQDVVVNAAYLGDQIIDHLRGRSSLHIQISREDTPLETGGGIAHALPLLGTDPFIVLNSDVILVDPKNKALTRMMESWDEEAMDILMLLQPVGEAVGFHGAGDFDLKDGVIFRPPYKGAPMPYIYSGVQILHPRIFCDLPSPAFSMNILYDRLKNDSGGLERIGFVIHDGGWLHVGDPDAIRQAEDYLKAANMA